MADLCQRFLETIQHQKPKTVERKTLDRPSNAGRLAEWSANAGRKVPPLRYRSVAESLRVRLGFPQSTSRLCQRRTPHGTRRRNYWPLAAVVIKAVKLAKPIRPTPTFDEFRAIVDDIRSQQFNAETRLHRQNDSLLARSLACRFATQRSMDG